MPVWIESQTELPARKENKTCGWGLCGGCPHHPESPPPLVLGVSGSARGAPGFGFDPDVLDLNFCAAAGKKGAEAGGRRLPSPDPGGRGPGTWMERPSRRGGGRLVPGSSEQAGRQRAPRASPFPGAPAPRSPCDPGEVGVRPPQRPARPEAGPPRSRGARAAPRVRARGPGERARAGGRGPRGP